MSLINDMLRDLARRDSPYKHSPILQHTFEVTKKAPVNQKGLLLMGLLLIILSIYGAYQYGKHATKNSVPDPEKISVSLVSLKLESIASRPVLPVIMTQAIQAIEIIPIILKPEPQAQMRLTKPERNPKMSFAIKRQEQISNNSYEGFLAVKPLKINSQLNTRLLQIKSLLDLGQKDKAALLLDESLSMYPANLQLINTRAQLYLTNKNPQDALKILQSINSRDEVYLSLLAASFEQLQFFSQAALIYAQLIRLNSEKAQYWLGLGLSQEKSGNANLARDAYIQALSINSLDDTVTIYIKQRLNDIK